MPRSPEDYHEIDPHEELDKLIKRFDNLFKRLSVGTPRRSRLSDMAFGNISGFDVILIKAYEYKRGPFHRTLRIMFKDGTSEALTIIPPEISDDNFSWLKYDIFGDFEDTGLSDQAVIARFQEFLLGNG